MRRPEPVAARDSAIAADQSGDAEALANLQQFARSTGTEFDSVSITLWEEW